MLKRGFILRCLIIFNLHVNIFIYGQNSTASNQNKMAYKIEPLPSSFADLGEGPHWDAATQSLYYVDLTCGKLLRYDYNKKRVFKAKIMGEDFASFVIPIEGKENQFAVGCGRRVVIVTWDGVAESCDVTETLFEVQTREDKFKDNRFNDAKCDPQGRLFAGTMRHGGDEFQYRWGELYKYENGKVSLVKSDVGISNGLAWNEKTKKFYYIDTTDFEVKEYDYDFECGTATDPKVVFDLRSLDPKGKLLPDGMTIDTDGNIYVATFNGYTIYKVNPTTREILLEIKFPCKQITSAVFGGPKLDILYVTTSSRFGEPDPAGNTYQVTGLGAKGFESTNMKI